MVLQPKKAKSEAPQSIVKRWRDALESYFDSYLFWDVGPDRDPFPGQVPDAYLAEVESTVLRLAEVSREVATYAAPFIDVASLLVLERRLHAGCALISRDSTDCVVPTLDAAICVDQIALRIGEAKGPSSLGNGGPRKAFAAACRAMLSRRSAGDGALVEGDQATLEEVKSGIVGGENERKKASDYLAPRGKLCKDGWLRRDGDWVILTGRGADEWLRREKG